MKIKEIIKGVFINIVSNIIWIIITSFWFLFLSNLSKVTDILNKTSLDQRIVYSIITAIIIIFISITILIIWKNQNKFKPNFPLIEFNYLFEELVVELVFINRKEIEYNCYFKVKALKYIKDFVRHYNWTGSSNATPEFIDNPENHHIKDHNIQEAGKHYIVTFNRPLYRNQKTGFSVRIKCFDELCGMHPHLVFRNIKPAKKLTLRVRTKEDLIYNVNNGVYIDDAAEIELEQVTQTATRNDGCEKIYEWVINKPTLLYYYRISWEFFNR